jgi:hypothetical protein
MFTVSTSDFLTTYFIGQNTGGGPPMYLYPINPAYCLSETKAKELAAALSPFKPVVVDLPPLGPNWGGAFVQKNMADLSNNKAPWLQFTGKSGNPVLLNAGIVASNFNHGYDQAYVENLTNLQISQAIDNG